MKLRARVPCVLICILSLVLGVTGSSPTGAWIALILAALVASGTWAGWALAWTSLLCAIGEPAAPPLTVQGALGLVAGGGALGLVAREAFATLPRLGRPRTRDAALWLCALALVACLLPDDVVWLYDAQGRPLLWQALLHDPMTGIRGSVVVPATLSLPSPLSLWLDPLRLLAPLVAFLLVSAAAAESSRVARLSWHAMGVLGLGLTLVGGFGLARLLEPSLVLPSAEVMAMDLMERAVTSSSVRLVDPPEVAHLGPRSLPFVDGVRVLVGFHAMIVAWRPPRLGVGSGSPGQAPSLPAVAVALALAVLAATFLAPAPIFWALASGGVLGASAMMWTALRPEGTALRAHLLVGAALVWTAAWLGPLSRGGIG